MSEPVSFFLLFIAIIALMGTVFGTWVIVVVARALGRAVGLLPPKRLPELTPAANQLAASASNAVRRCPRENCRHENPMEAHFCARCGAALQPGTVATAPPKVGSAA